MFSWSKSRDNSVKMSKGQTLRTLVNERLTAAAEEIFSLFERTITEYEEELCRSKEDNQRKQVLLDSILGARVVLSTVQMPYPKQDITETPQIKEEPKEQRVIQEAEEQTVSVPESRTTQGEDIRTHPEAEAHASDEDCDSPFIWSGAPVEMETDEDHCIQAQNSDISSNYGRTLRWTSATVNDKDVLGTDQGVNRNKHQCSICKKAYKSKYYLQNHIRLHTGEKPFSCPICEKTFAQKTNVYAHVKRHTGERPFGCSVCEKTFVHKSQLHAHEKIHTGERPFGCSMCEKTFVHKSQLHAHEKRHTDRPYSCSACFRTFTHECHLNAHMRYHAALKNFPCKICKKVFTQELVLDAHMRVHNTVPKKGHKQVYRRVHRGVRGQKT